MFISRSIWHMPDVSVLEHDYKYIVQTYFGTNHRNFLTKDFVFHFILRTQKQFCAHLHNKPPKPSVNNHANLYLTKTSGYSRLVKLPTNEEHRSQQTVLKYPSPALKLDGPQGTLSTVWRHIQFYGIQNFDFNKWIHIWAKKLNYLSWIIMNIRSWYA